MGGGDKRIYGVTFNGSSSSIGTRTHNSIGMKFSPSNTTTAGEDDFSKIERSPFDIKECLTYYDSTQKKQIIYKIQGDPGYDTDRTNTNYNIMMRFPKFYYKRPSKWEFQVSSYPHEGFLPSPMHYRNGKMYDYVYIAKYHSNSSFRSQTGQTILTNATDSYDGTGYTIAAFREGFNNQGMYCLDIQVVSSLQILMLVKYATLDVQSIIGFGISNQTTKQNTGNCDSVKGLDGYCATNKTDNGSIVCLGIENLYGNLYKFIDGIFRNNSTIYINTDIANLAKGRTNPTVSNHPGYVASATPALLFSGFGWITDISYDSKFPWIMYPTATTGNTTTSPNYHISPGLSINDGYWISANTYSPMIAYGAYGNGFASGPFYTALGDVFEMARSAISAASFFLSN